MSQLRVVARTTGRLLLGALGVALETEFDVAIEQKIIEKLVRDETESAVAKVEMRRLVRAGRVQFRRHQVGQAAVFDYIVASRGINTGGQ